MTVIDYAEADSQFLDDLDGRGLALESGKGIQRDRGWQRCNATNKGRRGIGDGAYIYRSDGWPRWTINNHTDGLGPSVHVYKSSKEKTTPAERAQIKQAVAQIKRDAEEERARVDKLQTDIATSLRRWWARLVPADADHPYLVRKAVAPHGIRQWRNLLIVPMLEGDGLIWNFQFIAPDGAKRYRKGARAKSGLYVIEGGTDAVYVAEGFATAATIAEVTGGATVVVAFTAGKLKSGADYARRRWPDAKIVIAADDDWKTIINGKPTNIGIVAARKAARELRVSWAKPKFDEQRRGVRDTDFNDMLRVEGRDKVKAALDQAEMGVTVWIEESDYPAAAREVRDLLAARGTLFEYDTPVRIVMPAGSMPHAHRLTANGVVMAAHDTAQFMEFDEKKRRWFGVTCPERVARMYLDMKGDWRLRPLEGICSTPILADDGGMRTASGYDAASRLWCCECPPLAVPAKPTEDEARAALMLLRSTFYTFPFADAERLRGDNGIDVVITGKPPGEDESAFLIGLMTACCRPCLWLAPGLLLNAPQISGAGTGKGLLVRAINAIAYGSAPRALTVGWDAHELEKRVSAELMAARPSIFLDNVNGVTLKSDILASVLTERPAVVRILGKSENPLLCSTAWIAATGNGLSVTEDLARRFLIAMLDAKCEDPESRPFPPGFLQSIMARRAELLGAVLTIWRWGRQNEIAAGKPLGSYEQWAQWCRDPMMALGCRDPVERISETKAQDPQRRAVMDLFVTWKTEHASEPIQLDKLNGAVVDMLNPKDQDGKRQHSRQWFENRINALAGTRIGPYTLVRQKTAKWSPAKYVLTWESASDEEQLAGIPRDLFGSAREKGGKVG